MSGMADARIGSYVLEEWKGVWLIKNNNALLYLIVSCGFGNPGIEEEQCKLDRGAEVEFKPFQDWKVGEVRYCNCSGWIGRAVIR